MRLQSYMVPVVIAHAIVAGVHGFAHAHDRVPLSPLGNAFVAVFVIVAPFVALALRRSFPTSAAWLLGVAMSASLLFGLVNHFIVAGPDHVAHTGGALFGTTAALLVATEAAGVIVAVAFISRKKEKPCVSSSPAPQAPSAFHS